MEATLETPDKILFLKQEFIEASIYIIAVMIFTLRLKSNMVWIKELTQEERVKLMISFCIHCLMVKAIID